MKSSIFAVVAAIAAGVSAEGHAGRRHAHEAFHMARGLTTGTALSPEPTCSCTTIYTTITGAATLLPPPKPTSTFTPVAVVPTPAVTVVQPGTYTFPATTVTLTSSVTVCAATSTHVPAGSHTYGGVTTIVKTSTTVVCPYATIVTKDGVVTSKIATTTYVCPSAGTYTIAPSSTSVSTSTVIVYPTPVAYAPGTYTKDAVVTTVTKTDYVLFCPYTSSAPALAAPTVKVAPVAAPVASTTAAPVPAYTPPAVVEKPKAQTAAAPGKLGTGSNQWAITYTPYTEDAAGLCKEASVIKSDIALIASKGFKAIRVYSTDCGALEVIPTECEAHGLKMILGIFIDTSGIDGAAEQVTAILKWKQWNLVDLVVVGNEALHASPPRCSAGQLAAFIKATKFSLQALGYTGPVTTAEPLNVWQANAGELCGAVDVVGLNIHPFFNADVDASSAGTFAKGQLEIAESLCSGKDAYNLETGWPSQADRCNGKACAGATEQATAIKGIMSAIGGKSVMFSFGDDAWKQPGDFGCEQHWGSINLY